MDTTVRCRASAVKPRPRPAPAPQKEPHDIRPLRWNTSLPRLIWSTGITASPVEADTKLTTGGAPVYVHVPRATSPARLIAETTANCSPQFFLASSHFPKFPLLSLPFELLLELICPPLPC